MTDDAPPSLHRRILADPRDRIVSGARPFGTRIPFETALAERFGCSRTTVNKVLGEPVHAGLIERRRKAGSFVRRPHSYSAVMQVTDVRREVEAQGLGYGYESVRAARQAANGGDTAMLGVVASDLVLSLRCRHFAARQPFCVEARLLDLAIVPDGSAAGFTVEPPGAWPVSRGPWTSAEHGIRAIGADPVAAALIVPKGTPCPSVDRRTWDADASVTAVKIVYPGLAHEIVARFAPMPSAASG